MKKINKSGESKSENITREEQEQYMRDVAAAFDKAWEKLVMLGDENGYVTVDIPMSPEEKRELGIDPSEEISFEPTDPKGALNRLKAATEGAQKAAGRLSREIHDLKEAADKNGGKIPNVNEIAENLLKEQGKSNMKKGKTYVISDIHGRYDKYMEMLKKINFGPDDALCFLGDAMDRGPDGVRIMLDIMSRPNVHSILGNREAMALDALPVLETVRDICNGRAQDGTRVTADEVYNVNLWLANVCKPTVRAYMKLPKTERTRIFRYMKSLPLYREIEVEGRKFILVHAALGNFSPDRPLEDYSQHDLVWDRPTRRTKYFDDKTVIIGHTPSVRFGAAWKFYHGNGFIDIDCGCVFGYTLGCLCLDNMEEIYV